MELYGVLFFVALLGTGVWLVFGEAIERTTTVWLGGGLMVIGLAGPPVLYLSDYSEGSHRLEKLGFVTCLVGGCVALFGMVHLTIGLLATN